MLIVPIGTDVQTRRMPAANVALIIANALIFLLTDHFGGAFGQYLKRWNVLDAARPLVYQYVTYQFLHADWMHLIGNMIFLWIFGNAVCERMGNVAYVFFYLAGGVFSGVIFAAGASNPILGASGAIAAITTAYLVLFPRSRVNLLFLFVFVTTIELPALYVIVFKVILWDNILAPAIERGAAHSSVAYSAHLGGYAFGLAVGMLMLAIRAVPRSQFDMLALVSRWRRRQFLSVAPPPRRVATARPVQVDQLDSRPLSEIRLSPVERLRAQILERLAERDEAEAVALYTQMMQLDPEQVLPRQAQLEIANQLARLQRHHESVAAYEAFLAAYPTSPDAPQVRLLVGLIYNRYLGLPQRAVEHLRRAAAELSQPAQRALALDELRLAEPGGAA
ncbi:MAG: hypothetical protein CHACPFDD_00811 [Phycisphaerae bacterium]|nr:hypothetical protein [Phycisphaerae bacterium]